MSHKGKSMVKDREDYHGLQTTRTWKIHCKHFQENKFLYALRLSNNRICNKILDRDSSSARLFVT